MEKEEQALGAVVPESTQERGIFDCDDAYRTPSQADYQRLFSSAIIVLDTNVLINLYRSNERTRRDTFAVLNQLRGQIWIPHQVLSEFWRNRDLPSVRGHHKSKAREAGAALDKVSRSMKDALERWLKDVHLMNDGEAHRRVNTATQSVLETFSELKDFIEDQAKKDALEGTSSTSTDPVLRQLEPLLRGRIGDPFSEQLYAEALSEAARRATEEIPPGYKDFQSGKSPEQAAGDYIIWAQILVEAEQRRREVLLVTGDVKEDWWTSSGSQGSARPRTELRVELKKRAGVDLHMLTPSQLLAEADRIFGLKVDERSVSDLATSEVLGAGIHLPVKLAAEIPSRLQRAHDRAVEVVNGTGVKRLPYSVVLTREVLRELNSAVRTMGGSSILVRSKEYPVLQGHLLFPVRYASHPVPINHVLKYLNGKKTLRDFFGELEERQYDLSLTDLTRSPTGIPGLLGPSGSSLKIVVIPFSAGVEYGLHVAFWGTLYSSSTGTFNWRDMEPLFGFNDV
ncbi:PIN-like domain-containing protein [Streptomyces sp. NPDC001480]|uniref:PIN-like domain-containing protein n=1 Tax=Streptomyces sp. NPDC001480 TaxID=3364577 RepID=UPI00368CA99D